jgi:hypothetical protein
MELDAGEPVRANRLLEDSEEDRIGARLAVRISLPATGQHGFGRPCDEPLENGSIGIRDHRPRVSHP